MVESAVRPWTRPYDWAEVVLGAVALLSPFWTDTSNTSKWSVMVLGALVLLDGLASLARPGMVYGEGVQIVLGVLLVIAPWVMGYTALTGASWASWIVGVLTVLAGAAALPVANAAHGRMAGSH